MKILLCNIPIRPQPTTSPPIACTVLLNALIQNGYNPLFYNIDAKRPTLKELFKFFKQEQFDIVGISAVISTGYQYCKLLSRLIKKASPNTKIILGGNLASSYEVILHKCKIDICVIGKGEKVLLDLVGHLEKYGDFKPTNEQLHKIKGIVFMTSNGISKLIEQDGYLNVEIPQADYQLLEKFSNINQYIIDPMTRLDFWRDPRSHQDRRKGKKLATIFASKGCVNKCAFCHRWIRGYRAAPAEGVIAAMKGLINRYNVGFFSVNDECFGEGKQQLNKFIELVKPLDILFQVGGARVSIVKNDSSLLNRLKDAGLTAIYFGMESGSDKILRIMEKNSTVKENLKAAKICAEAGIFTAIQLVIGMPGENEKTINETIEFLKEVTKELSYPPQLSINYLQALPGTPCYEFLRQNGFLGKTIDDEEKYLLRVSDIDAGEYKQYINVSEEPLSKVCLWQKKIYTSVRINWIKLHGYGSWIKLNRDYKSFTRTNLNNNDSKKKNNIKTLLISRIKLFIFNNNLVKYSYIKFLENLYWKLLILKNRYSLYAIKRTFLITIGMVKEENRSMFQIPDISLRRLLAISKGNINPMVSVVIPTHNHAHFLPECLASVKSQTYKNFEVIVINNGSTDNTEEIVRKLSWDQLRYHYQDDTSSVAGPRNTGIQLAKGKYVAFLDSDDLWYEKKLESIMNVLERRLDIDVISHDLYMTKNGNRKMTIKCGPLRKNMFKSLLIQNNIPGSASVVRRNTLMEAGGFNESKDFIHAEDSELWLRIAQLDKKFYFINEALGEYRIHDANLSYDFESLLRNEKNVIRKHFKSLKSNIPFHGYFLYINRLARIYFKLSMQYYFRKRYVKCVIALLQSILANPFYLPFNMLSLIKMILNR